MHRLSGDREPSPVHQPGTGACLHGSVAGVSLAGARNSQSPRMSRPHIAVDLDDTLCPLVESLNAWILRHDLAPRRLEEYVTYDFSAVWSTTPRTTRRLVRSFIAEESLGLQPIENSVAAINVLRQDARLIVVTSREERFRPVTELWLNHHFPGAFDDLIMVGNQYSGGRGPSKGLICRQVAASCLIDDQVAHVSTAWALGVHPLLFGDYPWQGQPQRIPRAFDWSQALTFAVDLVRATGGQSRTSCS